MEKTLTTIADAQREINALAAIMAGKGLVKPEADFKMTANEEMRIILTHQQDRAGYKNPKFEFFRGNSLQECLDRAIDYLSQLPSVAEANRARFMRAVADAIEIGKEIGEEVEFLNPLVETMKRLSENAITHEGAGK